MKCGIFAIVFGIIWMIITPINAIPYPEAVLKTNELSTLDEATAQGCSFWTGLECARVVFLCGHKCVSINVAGCINCAGNSYSKCKDCFSRQEELQSIIQEAALKTNALSTLDEATAQGCGRFTKIKCAYVVAKCVKSCYNRRALECVKCAGSSYSTCKDCFSRQELLQSEMQGAVLKTNDFYNEYKDSHGQVQKQ